STLESKCECYTMPGKCTAGLESPVASCTAASTGDPAATCGPFLGPDLCLCSSGPPSGTATACPSAVQPICCLDGSSCSCSYGDPCPRGARLVPSCSADLVPPPAYPCSFDETAVERCQ